jgi:hypothetical protein
VGAHLVTEHQAPWIYATHLRAPEQPQELVSFRCLPRTFFGPERAALPPGIPWPRSHLRCADGERELGPLRLSVSRPLPEVLLE